MNPFGLRKRRNIKLSWNTLTANGLRSLLALAGIAMGVAAVTVMVAIGRGAQQQVTDEIQRMGTQLITVKAGQVEKMIRRERQFGNVTSLRPEDAEAIKRECPQVIAAVPLQDQVMKVKYGTTITSVEVIGATSEMKIVRNYTLKMGRFFSPSENRAGMRVAVVGFDVYKNLFRGIQPLGQMIRVEKISFKIIGVLEPVGAGSEGGNEDNRLIIPLRTALRRVFNLRHLKSIYVKVSKDEFMKSAETQIRLLLRRRHRLDTFGKTDDFTIHNQVTALEMAMASNSSFTLLTASIASIALLVGGVGIWVIMMLSVKERTGEIGLRRAVGARASDILIQFLYEAAILGLMGGGMGCVLGIVTSWILGELTPLTLVIPLDIIGYATLFSLAIGLFCGVYPAGKAAKMDPITALKAD